MTERTRFHVYITKYAITDGLQEMIVEDRFDISPDMVIAGRYKIYHKPHWHRTREEAIKQAEMMRAKKISSVKKQIARLENLVF